MFIGGQTRAAVSATAATARLACPADAGVLVRASYAAWEEGTARIAPTGLPGLAVVRSRGPVRRGAVSALILRWEAAAAGGQLFPVLDADITLIPDGDQATLIGLDGVYRPLPGPGPCPVITYLVTAATVRSLLGRIAAAITDPAAPDSRRIRRSPGRPRPARGQQRVDERAQVHPLAADRPRLDLHHLSRSLGPAAVGIDPQPTWNHRPALHLD